MRNIAKPGADIQSPAREAPGTLRSSDGELDLIESIRLASAARPHGRVRLGIGDDCAILRPPPGHEILVTTDFCLEGRHFWRDGHTPESAGHRCLARGLSDLAAMGAKPVAAFLSLAIPPNLEKKWLDRFFIGLRALADAAHVPLAGGDTAQSPSEHILADIVLVGSAPAGRALRRGRARPGDLLYVTGSLGGAAAELLSLRSAPATARKPGRASQHPQLFPAPRIAVGNELLRRNLATACIDTSDGLSTDLQHLCDASRVAAELYLDRLPIHLLAARLAEPGRLDLTLHGGEDYELLFSAAPGTKIPRSIANIAITQIGRFTRRADTPSITAIDQAGIRSGLEPGGWEHMISAN